MGAIKRTLLWPDPRVKPSLGTAEIDFTHELGAGLRGAFLFSEVGARVIRDWVVPGYALNVSSGQEWMPTLRGAPGIRANAGNEFLEGASSTPTRLRLGRPLSIVWRGHILGTPGDESSPFGVTHNSSFSSPFTAYQFRYLTGAGSWYYYSNEGGSFGSVFYGTAAAAGQRQLGATVQGGAGAMVGYVDGLPVVTGASFGSDPAYGASSQVLFGGGLFSNANCIHDYALIYAAALTPYQMRWLDEEPYVFLSPIRHRHYSLPGPPQALPAGAMIGVG